MTLISPELADKIRAMAGNGADTATIASALGIDQGDALSISSGAVLVQGVQATTPGAAGGSTFPVDWTKSTLKAPGGRITAPTMPASTVAQTNKTNRTALVTVSGGTVTVIAVGGSSTGRTSGTVAVASGQTITITYSVAPTWVWDLV